MFEEKKSFATLEIFYLSTEHCVTGHRESELRLIETYLLVCELHALYIFTIDLFSYLVLLVIAHYGT